MAAFLDGCRFNPAAGGTADWTYASAVNGYQSPAAANAVNGRLYKYRAESADLSQWEFGEGAYNSATGVLARTTVLYNSSGTASKIDFSTVPQIAIVALKEDLLSVDEANSFTVTQQAQARSNIGVTAIGAAQPGQIPGTTGTTLPAAGTIGERISANTAATISASGASASMGTITVTPGIWDVEAIWITGGPGATTTTDMVMSVTLGGALIGISPHYRLPAAADVSMTITLPRSRVAVSSNSVITQNFQPTFSGASYSASGTLFATRVC